MADIERFNEYLQARLLAEFRAEINAVEAARWLDEQGLLGDRRDRPGQSLRKLLRAGLIVGAVQRPRKPYGRWRIQRAG
ncbi:MAG: hypothetical protein OXI73_06655 [Rhodospirillales bacterium]|nr:hypothetical protein [Rhodospirillales bacterium]